MLVPLFSLFVLVRLTTEAFNPAVRFSRARPTFISNDGTKHQPLSVVASHSAVGTSCSSVLVLSLAASEDLELERVPASIENVPIPFVDPATKTFIECYADSVVTIEGETYTIAVPCDYSVALCYFDEDEQLIPIELNDPLMDDIFPMAESIVAEEFGEELVLERTPQTLTLVGELEEEEDEEEDEDDVDNDEDDEEVEVLLSFEHRGKEINLVRLLDPILLVGKNNPDDPADTEEECRTRLLLTPEESDKVMPLLEDLFLKFHDDSDDSKLP